MKTLHLLIILSIVCTFPPILFSQDEADNQEHRIVMEDPSQYLPDYLDNIYIGMPLADFENVKDTLTMDLSDNESALWYGIRETVNDQGISEITYKFDKEEDGVNAENPLYQINIVFLEPDYQNDYLQQKFNIAPKDLEPTNKEWEFSTDKNYLLIVRQNDNEVMIIATMPGTEWDSNN
ncbi:MAG TPA: hypothetical protein VF870_08320 [Ignavibacteriaceae bacterium]